MPIQLKLTLFFSLIVAVVVKQHKYVAPDSGDNLWHQITLLSVGWD